MKKFEIFGGSLKSEDRINRNSLNEDSFLFNEKKLYGIVADGAGGPEIAIPAALTSKRAANAIADGLEELISQPDLLEEKIEEESKNIYLRANAAILHSRREYVREHNKYIEDSMLFREEELKEKVRSLLPEEDGEGPKDIGTTATSFFVYKDNVYVIHVGDSEAYVLYDNDEFQQITETINAKKNNLGLKKEMDTKKDIQFKKIPLDNVNAIAIMTDGIKPNKEELNELIKNNAPREVCYKLLENYGSDDKSVVVMKAKEELLPDLEKKISEIEKLYTIAEERNKEQESEIRKINQELENKTNKSNSLSGKLSDLQSKYDKDIGNIKKERDEWKAKAENQSITINDLRAISDDLINQVETEQKAKGKAEEDALIYKEKIAAGQDRINALEKAIQEAGNVSELLANEKQLRIQETSQYNADRTSWLSEKSQYKAKIKKLEQIEAEKSKLDQAFAEQKTNYEARLRQSSAEKSKLEQELVKQKNNHEEALIASKKESEDYINRLTNLVSEQRARAEKSEQKLGIRISKIEESLKKEYKIIEEDNLRLSRQNEEYKSEIKRLNAVLEKQKVKQFSNYELSLECLEKGDYYNARNYIREALLENVKDKRYRACLVEIRKRMKHESRE